MIKKDNLNTLSSSLSSPKLLEISDIRHIQKTNNPIISEEKALRPKILQDYIGQEKIRQQLNIYIQAAKQRQEALDHVLLFGPPGLGKTTLSHIIATEMGGQIKQTSGPVLEKAGDLAALLTSLSEGDVLFIDEIHRLSPVVEEILYPALEDYQIDIMIGEGPGARSIKIDLPPFTLIGATTRAGMISNPLRDRFGITARLMFYTPQELQIILQRSAKLLGISIDETAALNLAKRCRGTPRIANRLLRRCRDFAQIKNHQAITEDIVQEALLILEVDPYGLDELDHRLLRMMLERFEALPVGLDNLAASLGEEKETIEEVIEPYLLQEGYIFRTPRGRQITPLGIEILKT